MFWLSRLEHYANITGRPCNECQHKQTSRTLHVKKRPINRMTRSIHHIVLFILPAGLQKKQRLRPYEVQRDHALYANKTENKNAACEKRYQINHIIRTIHHIVLLCKIFQLASGQSNGKSQQNSGHHVQCDGTRCVVYGLCKGGWDRMNK